jgi:hypothetical protein
MKDTELGLLLTASAVEALERAIVAAWDELDGGGTIAKEDALALTVVGLTRRLERLEARHRQELDRPVEDAEADDLD